jgi:hypothetical protein
MLKSAYKADKQTNKSEINQGYTLLQLRERASEPFHKTSKIQRVLLCECV